MNRERIAVRRKLGICDQSLRLYAHVRGHRSVFFHREHACALQNAGKTRDACPHPAVGKHNHDVRNRDGRNQNKNGHDDEQFQKRETLV